MVCKRACCEILLSASERVHERGLEEEEGDMSRVSVGVR